MSLFVDKDKLTKFDYKDGLVHLNNAPIHGVISYQLSSVLDGSGMARVKLDFYVNSDILIQTHTDEVIYNYYDDCGNIVMQIVKDEKGDMKEIRDYD